MEKRRVAITQGTSLTKAPYCETIGLGSGESGCYRSQAAAHGLGADGTFGRSLSGGAFR